jgi:gamma-tubulin complex component 2
MFATYTASLGRYLTQADPDLAAGMSNNASTQSKGPANNRDNKSSASYDPTKVEKLYEVLKRYEDNFSRHLRIMLDTLNYLAATETVVFLSLCARLDTAGEGLQSTSDGVGLG